MKTMQQFAAVVPYGDSLLANAEKLYDFSRETSLGAYSKTKGEILRTKKNYLQFRSNLNKTLLNIVEETANQIIGRFQNLIGVESSDKSPTQARISRQRLQVIFQTIMREYILRNRLVKNQKVQALVNLGKRYSVEYVIPLYISLRASLIVTKQMLIEFMESKLNNFRLSYESSKDNVVMFIAGSFDEQKIKTKFSEGLNSFKRFTITIVSKGMEIVVDRQSLVQNYDRFTANFLEVAQELTKKGEGNIKQIKKKSRDLYEEVVRRIRAKQLQLKAELRIEGKTSESLKTEQ